MRHADSRIGIALFELIPAILLIAMISMISMKLLFIDLHLRKQTRSWELVRQSHKRVFPADNLLLEQVALCRLDADNGWEVLYFPDGTWVPEDAGGNNWIMWRNRILEQHPYELIGRDYRLPGSTEWRWWDTTITIEHENEPAK